MNVPMSDRDRHSLSLRLFGSGKRGEDPGPLDAGWVVRHLAGTRQTLKRWRERGIPPDRVDDVLQAVAEVTGTPKEAPPEWVGRLEEKLDTIEERVTRSVTLDLTEEQLYAVSLRAAELAARRRESEGTAGSGGSGGQGSTAAAPQEEEQ